MKKYKILNLYACLGGNRYKWDEVANEAGIEIEVTAVELEIPTNSIIYCDIPYQGTKQYSTSKDFNHSIFWNWCREKAKQGHTIFVSEYNAPTDFECVWQKEAKSSLSANGKIGGNKISMEKLFKFSPTNVQ